MRIGVIGAGVAGLAAARTLRDRGHSAVVFDKSRGVGGRTAVRRAEPFAFDHGAQYFTARDARFQCQVDAWIDAGVVAAWPGRIVSLAEGRMRARDSTTRYVGVPSMNAIGKHLAMGLDVLNDTRVSKLRRHDSSWRLVDDAGRDLGVYDAIVAALPSAQAADLLATAEMKDARIRRCRFAPCWAVLLGFDCRLELPFDGAFANASALSWVARNNSKPGRPRGESWVLHAGPAWSVQNLECATEAVAIALIAEFERITNSSGLKPVHRDAQRWRYALPLEPLDEGCIADADARWVVCGDWCHGARVEGAFLSGIAAARKLLGET
jgi:renalase